MLHALGEVAKDSRLKLGSRSLLDYLVPFKFLSSTALVVDVYHHGLFEILLVYYSDTSEHH